MHKLKLLLFIISIEIIFFYPATLFSQQNVQVNPDNTLLSEIIQKSKSEFFPPHLYTCLPPSINNDHNMESIIRTALLKKYPELKSTDIIGIIFNEPGWRILRNEFTAFITGRYIFVKVLINSNIEEEYYILQFDIMQNNAFLGLKFHPAYVRSLLSVDRIKKNDINNICNQ